MQASSCNVITRILISVLATASLASAQQVKERTPVFPQTSNGWELVSTISHPPLKEASGFAASRVRSGILWTHNDGGAGANLFAVEIATGAILATTRISDVPNLDWEDAMTVSRNGQHLIAIADLGDNEKRRRDCVIHLFKESEQRGERPPSSQER